jgi:hypothetical protein
MRDACSARRRVRGEDGFEILEFALGTAADQLAVLNGADAGGVIAAIFHPPQSFDQPASDLFLANDSDDSAHI